MVDGWRLVVGGDGAMCMTCWPYSTNDYTEVVRYMCIIKVKGRKTRKSDPFRPLHSFCLLLFVVVHSCNKKTFANKWENIAQKNELSHFRERERKRGRELRMMKEKESCVKDSPEESTRTIFTGRGVERRYHFYYSDNVTLLSIMSYSGWPTKTAHEQSKYSHTKIGHFSGWLSSALLYVPGHSLRHSPWQP